MFKNVSKVKKMEKETYQVVWVRDASDSLDPLLLGNATGYPGVFQSNPHPYPSKPVPAATGPGFDGYGLRVL